MRSRLFSRCSVRFNSNKDRSVYRQRIKASFIIS